MKRRYKRMSKFCPICNRVTKQRVGPLASFCEKCKTPFDDDGDEIFGVEE